MHNDIFMLWLSSLVHQVGSRKLNELLEHFGDARSIFYASNAELLSALPRARQSYENIIANRTLEYINRLIEYLDRKEMVYISRNNPRYPTLLAQIPDPPVGIFYLGSLPADNITKVAIIGSRKCSEYGLIVARHFARPLAAAGVLIVSGMAKGVDSIAHKGALQGGGQTIAVLGCGIDICYPAESRELRAEIIKNGCVLSEYWPGVRPKPQYFPARNRIISGLSQAVIITEATLKSGTLITVDQAQDQGREVLAVPGNISSRLSQGTNQLIREGAHPVCSYEDILDVLGITPIDEDINALNNDNNTQNQIKNIKTSLAPDEKRVYDKLSLEPMSFDALVEETGISISTLHHICTMLELKRLIKKLPGSRFIKEN